MGFPRECDMRWSRDRATHGFVAHVGRGQCGFRSVAFKQVISPDMTYTVTADSFFMEETLYGEDGRPVVPPLARQGSRRVAPSATTASGESR
jgi:hypothetical protein